MDSSSQYSECCQVLAIIAQLIYNLHIRERHCSDVTLPPDQNDRALPLVTDVVSEP